MTMTTAMEDVWYNRRDFNVDQRKQRHPMWITEKHFLYHLKLDTSGYLECIRGQNQQPLISPRSLIDTCIYNLVQQPHLILAGNLTEQVLPTSLFFGLLTEAVYQREVQSIATIVSIWPTRVLCIHDVIPAEDDLDDEYMTTPLEGNENMSLVDCFIIGLLKLKPSCNLQYIDFTGFNKDRKLCRELCRLPILWMKPSERTPEVVHEIMSNTIDVSKDKVERYLNRISLVYSNFDNEIRHGTKIGTVTILLDLLMHLDDIPLGLSLQKTTPFRYSCYRMWVKDIPEVQLSSLNYQHVLDSTRITHLEIEDPALPSDSKKINSLLQAINAMNNLVAVSLPNSINVTINPSMTSEFNGALKKKKYLQRLNFSYCDLRGHLYNVLQGLRQKLVYLNLSDCRLQEDDMFFLVHWRPLESLRELDLSRNNLMYLDQVVIALLERTLRICCLSLSYCSLSIHSQIMIAKECRELAQLKVFCMQSYIPNQYDILTEILNIACKMRSLQKINLLPEVYAFPGNNDHEREATKFHIMDVCYRFLELNERPDVQLE